MPRNCLIQARKEMGYTQKQLAERLSVSFQTVSKLETGTRDPSIRLADKYEDFFGISHRELFAEHE